MKKLILMCLLLSCRDTTLVASPVCTVNNCRGFLQDGNCVPETAPEDCNGIDDDCDGKIDPVAVGCATQCGSGIRGCNAGVWGKCSAPQPTAETCNGIDDDCDGVVDNIAPSSCYSGDPVTQTLGTCHGGSERCMGGQSTCFGEVVPVAETCDGFDNDCDGQVDEEGNTTGIDAVFIIDTSGSMQGRIPLVASSLSALALDRSAVLLIPSMTEDRGTSLLSNFPDGVKTYVQQRPLSNYGSEPSLDAMYLLEVNYFNLNYKPGNKKVVVVITDEEPQSYFSPPITRSDLTWSYYIFTESFIRTLWANYGTAYSFDDIRLLQKIFASERCP